MLDAYLRIADALLPVVMTVPVWGPLLLVGTVAVLMWQRRPAARAVSGHVSDPVRTCADTGPDTHTPSAVTCADACPGVSADTRADVPGREARGEQ
ncbi:hypothetical protein [Streptomyces sp. OK228]|uniref:hypothetical protein n=1 Tax=Streptomyces sp. OK228 TaxID=1882786 RepID=UPI000BD4DC86|nr:hypothetical protein [Streptomyces sp. OK228]SOE31699.1 hypothetical protein SAMN05442782_8629 [Streptomyces sp. OK228]